MVKNKLAGNHLNRTNNVNRLVFFIVTPANQEVFGFDITVDKIVSVHHFYSINLLSH